MADPIYGSFVLPSPAPEKAEIYKLNRTSTTQTDADILATVNAPKKDDFAIITTTIGGVEYDKSAFVYDGTTWVALTGPVDADKVIMRGNLTLAGNYSQVGNVTKAQTGTGTLNTDGKSVAEILEEIFTKTVQPTPTNPSATAQTITVGGKSGKVIDVEAGVVVGNITFNPVTFNPGSYPFGPATGITATGGTATGSNGASVTLGANGAGTYNMNTALNPGETVTFSSVLNYTEGAVALDNMGDPSDPEVKIAAGQVSLGTVTLKAYQTAYAASLTEVPANWDADTVAALAKTGKFNGGFDVAVTEGAKAVAIAVPATMEVTAIKDAQAFNTNILGAFTSSTVAIGGVNYKVYVYTPVVDLGESVYHVTVA